MSVLTKIMGAVSSYQSVMSLISSTLAQDVVYIGDESGDELFTSARIMKAGVNLSSTLMEHPLENGNTIVDFKIDKPAIIQIAMLVPTDSFDSVYKQIRQAKESATPLIVQTRADTYTNLIISDMPHEEDGSFGDCLAMSVTLREVQWYTTTIETLPAKEVATSKKSADGTAKPDADTVKQGQKRSTDASATTQKRASSTLYDWTHSS